MDGAARAGDDAHMVQHVLCEVCVDSVDGVRAAARGGAERIELCSALEVGGLTPSLGLARLARRETDLPIFAMVRPRPGDFVVDGDDVAWMGAEIAAFRDAGMDGVVLGALTVDGRVARGAVAALLEAAEGLAVTFHRAIDCTRDPVGAVEELASLGVPRVLTSGGAPTAVEGAGTIREMVDRAAGRLLVMAGSGVRSANVRELVDATGVPEVHLSAGRIDRGPARWVNARCGFAAPGRKDDERRFTDADEVRRVVGALR